MSAGRQPGPPKKTPPSKTTAVAKRATGGAAAARGRGLPTDAAGNLAPGRYQVPGGELRITKIQRAEQYNVLAVAKAMNPDLAPKVKQLFEPEMLAVEEAKASGWYFAWRPREPPFDQQDCQRVHSGSRCFCGHELSRHRRPGGRQLQLPCQACASCASFEWVPTRPEEAGEFWLKRRRDFDPSSWRAKCRCKHSHEEHRSDSRQHQCRSCTCGGFASAFVCAACDQAWEKHETVCETELERRAAGRPVGDDWVPFAEMEDVRHMVVHGTDAGGGDDVGGGRRALLPPGRTGGSGGAASGFRPSYD